MNSIARLAALLLSFPFVLLLVCRFISDHMAISTLSFVPSSPFFVNPPHCRSFNHLMLSSLPSLPTINSVVKQNTLSFEIVHRRSYTLFNSWSFLGPFCP
ncbi:hypothetical protein HDV57DRAFT_489388 [Trichoderma longibrachiatum]